MEDGSWALPVITATLPETLKTEDIALDEQEERELLKNR